MLELGNRSIEYVVTSYQLLHIGIAAIPARKGSLSYNFASYYYRLCLQMHQIILWNRIGIHCSSRHLLSSLTESPRWGSSTDRQLANSSKDRKSFNSQADSSTDRQSFTHWRNRRRTDFSRSSHSTLSTGTRCPLHRRHQP